MDNLKKQIIEEAKELVSDEENIKQEAIPPEFILDTQEGLFVVFPELIGEDVFLKKIKDGIYFYQIGKNYFYFPSEEIWKLLLAKKFIAFGILPYLKDKNGDIYRSFAGMEVLRIEFSEDDKRFFRHILEEIEKEKLKKQAQKELIEKLKKLGLSEEELEKALMEK